MNVGPMRRPADEENARGDVESWVSSEVQWGRLDEDNVIRKHDDVILNHAEAWTIIRDLKQGKFGDLDEMFIPGSKSPKL